MSDNELTPSEVEADLQANLSRQTLQYRLRARISNGAGKTAREAADRIDALEAQVAAHDNYWVKPWECPLCNQSVNNSGSSVYLHLVDHEYSEEAKIEALEAEIARLHLPTHEQIGSDELMNTLVDTIVAVRDKYPRHHLDADSEEIAIAVLALLTEGATK